MKSKIYYKICSKKPSNRIYCYDYYSAVAFSIGIQYILDKWVEPKIQGTNLMVFDSIENAKKCKKKYTHLCKMDQGDIIPEGTIFCKAVKILREVE